MALWGEVSMCDTLPTLIILQVSLVYLGYRTSIPLPTACYVEIGLLQIKPGKMCALKNRCTFPVHRRTPERCKVACGLADRQ
jgi:hypothetical protein